MNIIGNVFSTIFFLCASLAAAADTGSVPIAKIKESVICCPLDQVTFDGWASIDVGGEVSGWLWDIDGDGRTDTLSLAGEIVFTAPRIPTTRLVTLRVKDREGNISEPDSATLHVMDSPPKAGIEHDTTIEVGQRYLFRPKVTTFCSKIERYEWDFNDDGQPEFRSFENGNTSRIYYKPGKYKARFKATDSFGREAGGVQIISVVPDKRK